MRINEGRFPEELYVKQADKLKGVQEAQKAFNKHLEDSVKSGNPEKVKEILVTMVEETLLEPRSGSLESISDTVSILVSDYSNESDVIKQLLNPNFATVSGRKAKTQFLSHKISSYRKNFVLSEKKSERCDYEQLLMLISPKFGHSYPSGP